MLVSLSELTLYLRIGVFEHTDLEFECRICVYECWIGEFEHTDLEFECRIGEFELPPVLPDLAVW